MYILKWNGYLQGFDKTTHLIKKVTATVDWMSVSRTCKLPIQYVSNISMLISFNSGVMLFFWVFSVCHRLSWFARLLSKNQHISIVPKRSLTDLLASRQTFVKTCCILTMHLQLEWWCGSLLVVLWRLLSCWHYFVYPQKALMAGRIANIAVHTWFNSIPSQSFKMESSHPLSNTK